MPKAATIIDGMRLEQGTMQTLKSSRGVASAGLRYSMRGP
jgi:hypothetical protein